jgi:hypothetical protein
MMIFGLFLIMNPRGGHGHALTQSISNMRQLGMGLLEFESEFGRMPDDSTAELVRERYPETRIPMGASSSNDYFHQLFAAQIVNSRSIFYGFGVSNYRPEEWVEDELPLPPGSCGFAYIIHDAETTPMDTPLVVYPLVRGELVFDRKLCKLWGNRAVVLSSDLSAITHPIDSKGRLIIDGRDFFDPVQPHWNGNSFRVVWPE